MHTGRRALFRDARYQIADNMIMGASRNGTWVSLKNVHLCIAWLPELERKLFRARTDRFF